MNLILLSPDDLTSSHSAIIRDARRVAHIKNVHGAAQGDSLKVGLLGGNMGTGRVTTIDDNGISLALDLQQAPPAALDLILVLALPRPKMLRRILQTIATLGVKKLHLINSYRVEKSYWQTPFLEAASIHEQLLLGLEQGCDTRLPEVHLHKRFKPFVEDELPALIANSRALVAHPYTTTACPSQIDYALSLAVGPEGGFIEYEIALLEKCGFEVVHLGERIMRVETAVPYLLGRLF
ncbi:16S rRNA (uracil(1498)-N(3))-methyltransferase [Cellvibrio sp. PSBB023]|uniref:16S rRNA (uracil(1498)-N(3))-methyltransferase n=1 Tax=Cellvibrio sp. PSBB023 TaxID=1945512 RepID=UPI00098F821A|nr:16S rRNA (uracil(1498)-N(3))-methyltransferase [Cellvibrio sp. PSBB023]AQT62319.1 16S rRNA (uracil(1498)-N(3))-methyltransferase [Cellvibrio sp. PSBB023]